MLLLLFICFFEILNVNYHMYLFEYVLLNNTPADSKTFLKTSSAVHSLRPRKEAVAIFRSNADYVMNSKAEFMQPAMERVIVEQN